MSGAHLENGLLHVDLVRRVPEELKPRRIEISSKNAGAKTLEGNLATAAD